MTLFLIYYLVDLPSTSKGCSSQLPVTNNIEGWIGHALDPLGVLFESLTEVSIAQEGSNRTGKHTIFMHACIT